MVNKTKGFAFMVLSFNHENFILEHLESIRYLIITHGQEIKFQIIINDDCSSDSTVELIKFWLSNYEHLFESVEVLFNGENIGTCASLNNMCKLIKYDYVKVTSGDDVYSYENLFELSLLSDSYDIVSGLPLYLINNALELRGFDLFNHYATDSIYKNKGLINRYIGLSFNNAPNIVYKAKHLISDSIFHYVRKFDVVEDLPLGVAIAIENPDASFFQDNRVYVYYRRTEGSIYLVASKRFTQDINNAFTLLYSQSTTIKQKLFVRNRKFCFNLKSRYLRKLFNLSIYEFYFKSLFTITSIYRSLRNKDIEMLKHKEHYFKINSYSIKLLQKYESERS